MSEAGPRAAAQRRPARPARRALLVALALAGAALVVAVLGEGAVEVVGASLMSALLQLSALGVVARGLRDHRPRRRVLLPLLGGLVLWQAGLVGLLVEAVVWGGTTFPTRVEALFVLSFLGFGAAVLLDGDASASTRPRGVVALEALVLVGGGACATAGLLVVPLQLGLVDATTALGLLHPGVWATLLVLVVVRGLSRTRCRDRRSAALAAGLSLVVAADAALFLADVPGPVGELRLAALGAGMLVVALALVAVPGAPERPSSGVGIVGVVLAAGAALALLGAWTFLPAPFGGVVAVVALGTGAVTVLLLGLALQGERYAAQERHLARTDELTGAANRRALHDVAADAAGEALGLLLVDLDGFKGINDRLGHAAGDAVLVAVAGRLRRAAGAGGLLVRVGGDELAVLVRGEEASPERVEALARRCREAFAHPVRWTGGEVPVAGSVGTAHRPAAAAEPARTDVAPERALEDLMRAADAAMYAAKRAASVVRPRQPPPDDDLCGDVPGAPRRPELAPVEGEP
ncbi:GGDEF domain-containing protein [Pseudokineococcus sp. 1T1Z-3]|uniref:GGDEF domain-containing protein n=1 Tax=Pseudokineococcus sp. 1T1Z-3 TaxID=3132745 RepID=UPI003096150B